eukprot:TRINITY_DN53365_c0_g1_i1.p2 TRINITY_DN53365_c0_g1~~TRINITY_DN53365_c0_g1_i1.p2  ORF type:complete len:102 (+),score=4.42 TRINITY_DN53365_c0_g1_i1:662-967(+)
MIQVVAVSRVGLASLQYGLGFATGWMYFKECLLLFDQVRSKEECSIFLRIVIHGKYEGECCGLWRNEECPACKLSQLEVPFPEPEAFRACINQINAGSVVN